MDRSSLTSDCQSLWVAKSSFACNFGWGDQEPVFNFGVICRMQLRAPLNLVVVAIWMLPVFCSLGLLTMITTYMSRVICWIWQYSYMRIGLMSLRRPQMVNWGRDIGWPGLVLMKIKNRMDGRWMAKAAGRT